MSMISLISISVAVLCIVGTATRLSDSCLFCFLALAATVGAGAEAYRESKPGAIAFLAVSVLFLLAALRAATRRTRGAPGNEGAGLSSTGAHPNTSSFASVPSAAGSGLARREPGLVIDGEASMPAGDFEGLFQPAHYEALDTVCLIDVEVQLSDGSRWTAAFFPVAEAERRMNHLPGMGHVQDGDHFPRSNGAAIRTTGIDDGVRTTTELLRSGGFSPVFQPHDEEHRQSAQRG